MWVPCMSRHTTNRLSRSSALSLGYRCPPTAQHLWSVWPVEILVMWLAVGRNTWFLAKHDKKGPGILDRAISIAKQLDRFVPSNFWELFIQKEVQGHSGNCADCRLIRIATAGSLSIPVEIAIVATCPGEQFLSRFSALAFAQAVCLKTLHITDKWTDGFCRQLRETSFPQLWETEIHEPRTYILHFLPATPFCLEPR